MTVSNTRDIFQFFATLRDFKNYIGNDGYFYYVEYDSEKFPCIAYSTHENNDNGPDRITWHQFGMNEVIFFYEELKKHPELFAKVWVGENK